MGTSLIKVISVLRLISFFQKLSVTSKMNKIYSNKHQSQYNFFHTKLFTETLKHKESFWIIIQKLDPLTFEHVKMKKFNALIKHLRWQILNWTSHVMKGNFEAGYFPIPMFDVVSSSVTRLGDLLDFWQVCKDFGNN